MISTPQTEARREPSTPIESYVVRIYRRNPRFPARLTGTVEIVANGREVRFIGLRELARIIARQQSRVEPIRHDTL